MNIKVDVNKLFHHLIQCKYNSIYQIKLTLQVVVVGILGHTAVEECPGQVVHGILLVLHSLRDDLGIEVVMEAVVQVGLHWQRLVQELLKEVLSRKKTQKNPFGLVLLLYSNCFSPNHQNSRGVFTFFEP